MAGHQSGTGLASVRCYSNDARAMGAQRTLTTRPSGVFMGSRPSSPPPRHPCVLRRRGRRHTVDRLETRSQSATLSKRYNTYCVRLSIFRDFCDSGGTSVRRRASETSRKTSFSTVCFRSQQNHMPSPTKTRHGRKQGNGGTHEAAETINSYGLFRSRQGEEPGGFFPFCGGANDRSHRRVCATCMSLLHVPRNYGQTS